MLIRGWTTGVAALVLGLGASLATAQDDTYERDLEGVRKLVERRKWDDAKRAFDRLFEQYEGDRRIVADRVSIERDFQLALFHSERGKTDVEDLWGSAVQFYSRGARKLKLEFELGTRDTLFEDAGAGLRMLPMRFESVSIRIPADGKRAKKGEFPGRMEGMVLLGYNLESRAGYVFQFADAGHALLRMREDDVFRIGGHTLEGGNLHRWLELELDRDELEVTGGSIYEFEKELDGLEPGFVAFQFDTPRHSPSIAVEGKLERTWLDQTLAEHEHRAFEAWKTEEYDPNTALPSWLVDAEIEHVEHVVVVPPGVPTRHRSEVRRYLQALASGDSEVQFARASVLAAADRDGGFLQALLALEDGRSAEAERRLLDYLETELASDYPEAHLWLARIQARSRRLDEARTTLASVADELADDPSFHELAALLHLIEGDLETAREGLLTAREAGVWTEDLEVLAQGLEAAAGGPQWKRRYRRQSSNFEVLSDHSRDICGDVAQILQDATRRMVRTFRALPHDRFPTRVYVFSNRQGYVDFAEELLVDLSFSAGAYIPKRHIMVVWLPEDRSTFEATVRHECFHLFAHHFAETLPHWLNEGWAEYYGNEAEERTVRVHDTDLAGLAEAVERYRAGFDPVEELLRMRGGEFMEEPGRRYVQSWALVTWLAETEDEALKGLLDDYFEALVGGRSQDQAFDEVFAPVAEQLESGFRAFLNSL